MDIYTTIACICCVSSAWYFLRQKKRLKAENCLVVFSRYPIPGSTKTRLIPALGEKGAAKAQLLMTENILDVTSLTKRNIHTEVFYFGGTKSELSYWLKKRKRHGQLSWRPQSGAGLGEKLTNAFSSMFEEGAQNVIAVGSDIPGITMEIIEEAFDWLNQGSPVVIGKAIDGGYYLVGVSTKFQSKLVNLFSGIEWGTEHVFDQQVKRIKELGERVTILETQLSDVDTAEELPVLETCLNLSESSLTKPSLSVVIPVYNEVNNIVKTLRDVIKKCHDKDRLEIIISDGGSTDGTQDAVHEFKSQTPVPVTLTHSPPGRGFQLAHGTSLTKGDNLLFFHVDCILPESFDKSIEQCLEVPGNVAGAFHFDLDIFYPNLWSEKKPFFFTSTMSLIKKAANMRTRHLELPYGDQGIFMSKRSYDKAGGFDKVYLLEDIMLLDKLKKFGHIYLLEDSVITSARRWLKYGALKVTLLNLLIMFSYRCGVKPNTLAVWYYGDQVKNMQRKAS